MRGRGGESFDIDFGDSKKAKAPPRLSGSSRPSLRRGGSDGGEPTRPRTGTPTATTARSTSSFRPSSTSGVKRETARTSYSASPNRGKKFEIGQIVKMKKPTGQPGYFDVEIESANANGTYDVRHSTGKKEYNVRPAQLFAPSSSEPPASKPVRDPFGSDADVAEFRPGDVVEARYRNQWLPGCVAKTNRDGSYDIRFDSGSSKMGIPATSVRAAGISMSPRSPRRDPLDSSSIVGENFVRGDKVEAKLRNRWLPGRVLKENRDGTYDIRFEGGDVEHNIDPLKIREANTDIESKSDPNEYQPGDKIEARYRGGSKWYPGVIKRKNLRDGSYAIDYDDGESELRVAADLIRKVGGSRMRRDDPFDSEAEGPQEYRPGDKIEARYRGGSKWYPGVIKRKNLRDGSYAIDYDDGESELRVAADLIRKVGGSRMRRDDPFDSEAEGPQEYRPGDKIEARYRGGSKWYPGVIKRKNLRDGSYAIDYDDGESELRVAADLIRKVGGSRMRRDDPFDSEAEGPQEYRPGDKIEARYRGGSKWYPGVIKRKNLRDGSYAIDYDDGESELRVAADLIRKVGGSRMRRDDPFDSEAEGPQEYRPGDKIEARYRGGSKWYPGVIKRKNLRDGSYAIDYDDGESELRVAADLIRKVGGSRMRRDDPFDSEAEGPQEYRPGDKIEARYRGGSKWYPGVIKRKNLRDGSYAIDYDDGESELRVAADLIRKVGGSRMRRDDPFDSEAEGPQEYRPGDKIEARYRGGSKWYPGVIKRKNLRDGSYAIDYDDGESELRVAADLIRKVGGSRMRRDDPFDSEAEGPQEYRPGDKIEARYRGGSKWYPGVIKRKNLRDGSYAIDYDDGESELRVAADLIRKVGGSRMRRDDPFDSEAEGPQEYRPGDKIEARYRGGSKWYPGVIKRKNLRDGSYAIDYDDGESELRVAADLIRKVGGSRMRRDDPFDSEAEGPQEYRPGDKIEARYRGGSKWYPGVIKRKNLRDGSYAIDYDDGESELRVAADLIRKVGGSRMRRDDPFDSEAEGPQEYRPGDKIEARYRGGSKWYPGVIKRKNLRDGSYAIDYDDGESELRVAADLIRKVGGSRMRRDDPFDSEAEGPQEYRPGDKIEARYRGGSKWYPGVIKRKNLRDGSYAIDYDDGESELRVAADLIRKVGGSRMRRDDPFDSETEAEESFREGDKVEARFGGGADYYPGVITKKNRDGTYVIDYDDGDQERRVPAKIIRKVGGRRSSSPKKRDPFDSETEAEESFREGDKVEARFGGGADYYPGVITKKNRDGTYVIDYDDGDQERRVPAKIIRKVGGRRSSSPKKRDPFDSETEAEESFREGDKVEARFGGGADYYPGVITKKNRDGTYVIDYDDGDQERRVPAKIIRKLGGRRSSSPKKRDPFDSETEAEESFREGDKVEARFGGGADYYPGVITKKNRDGTYVIDYDDGDQERRVPAKIIRKVGGRRSSSPKKRDPFDSETEAEESFREGDKVEARFGGGADYYPGVITKKNRDGTYVIDYDDGDQERRVPAKIIRKVGGRRSSSPKKRDPFDSETEAEESFREGDKVEARFGGGADYYPGVITKKNRDGTYVIDYDDGDQERRVPAKIIRKVGGRRSSSPKKRDPFDSETEAEESFREGDKVEARFGGGADYYPGVITKKNRDGTYVIDYDDGDQERRVPAKIIRKVGGRRSSSPKKRDPFDSETEAEESFREGDKVEARFGGGADYYPGVITKKNRDGTYVIDYDDGDQERRVPAKIIRKVGGRRSSSPKKRDPFDSETEAEESFREGDKVEARFGGGADYYPGVITKKNRDGTYVIDYDDGDQERRVPAKIIRKVGSGARGTSMSFRAGEVVEVHHHGKWLPAKVSRKHGDDTYDLRLRGGKDLSRILAKSLRKRGSDDANESSDEDIRRGSSSSVISTTCRKKLRDLFRRYQEKCIDNSPRSSFVPFDSYGSGIVSKRDFVSALREIYGIAHPSGRVAFEEWLSVDEINELFSAILVPRGAQNRSVVRKSKECGIRYDAFLAFAIDSIEEAEITDLHRSIQDAAFKKSKYTTQNISALFEKVDSKKKGFIRFSEFVRSVKKFYGSLSSREENLLKSKFDSNSEGVVDYYAFCWWLGVGQSDYSEELSKKFRQQMLKISVDVLEDSLSGRHPDHSPRRGRKSAKGINCDEFESALGNLCVVLTSREIQAIFDMISDDSGNDRNDEYNRLHVQTIMKFIEKPSKKRIGSKSSDSEFVLLSDFSLTELQQSTAAFLENSRVGLSKVIAGFGVPDVNQTKKSSRSIVSASLNRAAFKKALEHIGCQLEDTDVHVLFESLDFKEDNSVSSDDLTTFLYAKSLGDDGSGEVCKVFSQIISKRRLSTNDFMLAFMPHDRRKTHLIESKSFEKTMETLSGTRPGITPTQMSELFLFFDPKRVDHVDYGLVCSVIESTINLDRVNRKLSHILKVMRIKEINYRSVLDEYEKLITPDELVAMFSRLQIPMTECELYSIAKKYQSRQKINVASMIEKLEAEEKSSSLGRYGRLFGSNRNAKDKTTTDKYDFGKEMFKKICKLRANEAKTGDCRAALVGKDPDLDGRISHRDFERTLNRYADLTEAELNLLAENMRFVDGSHRSEIDYPLFLLLLHEPIDRFGPVVTVGQSMMEKMLPVADAVNLRRLKALLFRNFAASDTYASGSIPFSSAERVLKDECPAIERKKLGKLLSSFQEPSSDNVLYPELLSFLCCCSLWNVMFNLHIVDKIRRKQGYNFASFLLKRTTKPEDKKLDREKTINLFLDIGILVTEVALESIFIKYSQSDDVHLNVAEFVKGLQAMESSDDEVPHKKDRKEVTGFTMAGDEGDEVSSQLLTEYDAKMLKAISLAFDMFDQNASNVIAALDLERVLSALGQHASPEEIQDLLQQIDPKETNEVEYNVFMDNVVPFIRSKYPLTFSMSEAKLRKFFKVLDMNNDGTVSYSEFRYILSTVASNIDNEEKEAMIEALDRNENGYIEWDEFRVLHLTTTDDDAMQKLPVLVRHGLRKLQYSFLPDPEKYLVMFAGLPSNYRLSVLADVEKDPAHFLGKSVCPSRSLSSNIFFTQQGEDSPKQFEFNIQILDVTGVPTEIEKKRKNIVKRSARFCICSAEQGEFVGQWNPPDFRGNVATFHGTVQEKALDRWHFSNHDPEWVDPDNSAFVKCSVSPEDHHSTDTHRNSGENLYLFMELVSTMRVEEGDMEAVLRYVKAEQEKERRKALLNKKKREAAAAAALEKERLKEEKANLKARKHLDTDIRFSAEKSLRASRRNKSTSGKKSDANNEEVSKKMRGAAFHQDDDSDGSDNANDKRKKKGKDGADDDEKDDLAENIDEVAENDEVANDPTLDDFKSYVTIEMSAGWIMIPIKQTLDRLSPGKSTKITLDMNGGSPFSLVGIQRSDVPRRKGLLEAIKRVVGMKINSKLQLLVTASPAPKKSDQPSSTAILPRNIILPTKTIDIITIYRKVISSMKTQPSQLSVTSVSLPSGDAVLSSFPRILNDPAAQRVLLLLWRLKAPKSSSKVTRADPNFVPPERLEAFNRVVLEVWHAMSCYNDDRSRLVLDESLDSIFAREMHLRNLVGIVPKSSALKKKSKSSTSRSSTGINNAADKTNTNEKFNPNQTSNLTLLRRSKREGELNVEAQSEVPQHDFKPFNVQELLWQFDNDDEL